MFWWLVAWRVGCCGKFPRSGLCESGARYLTTRDGSKVDVDMQICSCSKSACGFQLNQPWHLLLCLTLQKTLSIVGCHHQFLTGMASTENWHNLDQFMGFHCQRLSHPRCSDLFVECREEPNQRAAFNPSHYYFCDDSRSSRMTWLN